MLTSRYFYLFILFNDKNKRNTKQKFKIFGIFVNIFFYVYIFFNINLFHLFFVLSRSNKIILIKEGKITDKS